MSLFCDTEFHRQRQRYPRMPAEALGVKSLVATLLAAITLASIEPAHAQACFTAEACRAMRLQQQAAQEQAATYAQQQAAMLAQQQRRAEAQRRRAAEQQRAADIRQG